MATTIGLRGYDDRMPDLSPDGHAARRELAAATAAPSCGSRRPVDDVDQVTIAAMRERLGGATRAATRSGTPLSELNNIASPVQDVAGRLRPDADRRRRATGRTIADRLARGAGRRWTATSPRCGWRPSAATSRPRRQVQACIEQCEANLGPDGFFADLRRAAPDDGETIARLAARRPRPRRARRAGRPTSSCATSWPRSCWPRHPSADAVGRERYRRAPGTFLGATVDLAEAYAWGQEELARINALMDETADEIKPGASVRRGDRDARRRPGPDRWTGPTRCRPGCRSGRTRRSTRWPARHFDIPEPVRRLECRIAPTNTGVIYYTGPSDDFSRPGRMWWSVPTGSPSSPPGAS